MDAQILRLPRDLGAAGRIGGRRAPAEIGDEVHLSRHRSNERHGHSRSSRVSLFEHRSGRRTRTDGRLMMVVRRRTVMMVRMISLSELVNVQQRRTAG